MDTLSLFLIEGPHAQNSYLIIIAIAIINPINIQNVIRPI